MASSLSLHFRNVSSPVPTSHEHLPHSPVAQLVIDRPGRAHIFEHFGLDYCCGGDHSLATACREKNLDPATVTEMLDVTVRASPSSGAAD
ncbi:DUF542 domain-containing protein [Salinibacter altiplanensis]|uniref:DUF542 domain-containing protein n=1 Tax=Salinibacter altiplanensis TaxID=1803181 RepID=UPI002434631F|nr:DUF542 domain-containing protein [Salinibacter altiplanensis]